MTIFERLSRDFDLGREVQNIWNIFSWESVAQLVKGIRDYIKGWNKSGRKFVWTKKAGEILASIEKAKQPAPHFV